MALNYVTVTGTFEDGSGNPLPQPAYCIFTPSTPVYAAGIPLITPAQPIQAPISGGSLIGELGGALKLLATDNTGLTYGGLTGFFFWTVQVFINGQAQPAWSFFLPHTPSTIDLSALANTAAGSSGFANPMSTLGDIMYENATPAAARLAGNTSAAKQFLTQTGTGSVSAAPAWGAIAAGDVPTLNQNTTGTAANVTGTVAIANGGTGQVAQQAAMDALAGSQTSGQYLRGNGTHVQMSAIQIADLPTRYPWQFYLDDYCKGDGRQALVTVTNGSGVINTTPLGAPAAPTVSNSGSGGTIAAGTYQVEITYVNAYGETVASSSSSTTTSGSASTITINSPAPFRDAVSWYAYVTQAGGSTYFRQQGAGSPTAINVALVLTAPPTTSGANPPGSDTSAAQVFTNTATDGGKNIMICGAQGVGSGGGAPLVDTIASVQSPTQATLTSQTATGNLSGCAMVFSSDDRVNVDNCITAARTYALANDNFAQVIGGNKIYGLGTGLFQSTAPNGSSNPAGLAYNTQVRLPVGNQSGQMAKLEFQLLGPGDNAHAYFWVSALPNLNGTTFVSYSMGPTTADPTYGQQSVIGAPQGGTNFNGSNVFANVKAVIKGIQVVQPGWSNSIGIDLQWCTGMRVNASSQAYAPTTSIGGGVNPSNGWLTGSFWQAKIGTGLRVPNTSNNDDCVIESFVTEGITIGLSTQGDHLTIGRLVTVNVFDGIHLVPSSQTHDVTISQWSFEGVAGNALVNQNGSGQHVTLNITMDGENSTGSIGNDIKDAGNSFYGVVYWSDPARSPAVPTVTGAANLKIVNAMLGPGFWSGAPAAPASTTSQQNTGWRDAWITLSATTGITVITVDGQTTGLTAGSAVAVAIRVPAGKSYAVTYTGTLTTKWWLD